jgi:ABC-type molybdate transport system substrate-binding protein
MPVKGVKLVGELPKELQKYTVYVAVPLKSSPMVSAFIEHLTGPQARSRLAQAGYTPPE